MLIFVLSHFQTFNYGIYHFAHAFLVSPKNTPQQILCVKWKLSTNDVFNQSNLREHLRLRTEKLIVGLNLKKWCLFSNGNHIFLLLTMDQIFGCLW